MQIILASQSPRRKELLSAMGVTFDVVVSQFDEHLDDSRPPEAVAKELGLGKAMAVAAQYPEALVIGSDTIVEIGGRQLEKPHDEAEARATLKILAGNVNYAVSSLAVVCLNKNIQHVVVDSAAVRFKPYDEQLHETYLRSGKWRDKAGSYGIQSGAAPLIESITGNYDTVVGLPTHLLAPILRMYGIAAQAVELSPPIQRTASDL